MKTLKSMLGGVVLGAGWGAVSSLTNDVSSPYGTIGSRMVDTGWAWAAEVASLIANAGWAWAGVAVAAGWLVGARARGAADGVLALIAMTTAYYGMDSVLRQEPFASYWYEMRVWWLASLVFGSALGAVGGSIGRPGVIGLVAGLTVPIGAVVEMIWLPRWNAPGGDATLDWVRMIVWAAAAVGACVVVARFLVAARGHRPE